MRPVSIVHLYPRELGINGDVGNVTALRQRLEWRGVEVVVHCHEVGSDLPDQIDLVHVGSGPLSSQRIVHPDVLRLAPALRVLAAAGVPILAVAGGWQLLGREFVTPEGEIFEGAGIFPSRAVLGATRHVGEVVIDSVDGRFAGFENHSATTTLDDGATPLGTVVAGVGNDANAAGTHVEGVRVAESVGTHLHGPVFPMNPVLADRMLAAALARRGDELPPATPRDLVSVDGFAANARRAIAERLGVKVSRA